MAQIYSTRTSAAQSGNGVVDAYGVPLVSSLNDFGESPLGIAARSQALYGIANAQFNLLPREVGSAIVDFQNPLPYWSVDNFSDSRIVPKSFFDTTTGTFSVELDPTAGSASDYITLKTRSFLLTDDNLALRQKAYLTTSKGTAYAGATQFGLTLSAEYFDINGTSLSSYAIGTALDNTALTSISGVTTSGSAAISANAAYVDLTIRLDVTATVTSGVKVYLKSLLLATSQATTGSFIISEQITSSQTWTPPTGVSNLLAVVAAGAGGGGGGGGSVRGTNPIAGGGGGGGGAGWSILRDVSLGTATGVVIGIGAGGTGGTAMSYTVTGATLTSGTANGGAGANGGSTTVTIAGNAVITVPGGTGGSGGTARSQTVIGSGTAGGGAGGAAGTAVTFTYFGGTAVLGGTGSTGGSVLNGVNFVATTAGTGLGLGFANYPYSTFSAGAAGGNGVVTGTASGVDEVGTAAGSAGGSAHFGGGGGGGMPLRWNSSNPNLRLGTASVGAAGAGGGGGGAASVELNASNGTTTVNAGNGGAAGSLSAAGGGGGGSLAIHNFGFTYTMTATGGSGGVGSSGFVTVVYVA
jgi:hypothetical protein